MASRGCCGLKLRTISLMIGITFHIISSILLICTVGAWIMFSKVFQLHRGNPELPPEVMLWYARMENIVFLPLTVFFLLSVVFNTLLIRGARRSSTCAVVAWLIFYGIVFAIGILISVGLLFVCGVAHTQYVQLQALMDGDGLSRDEEALEVDMAADLLHKVALASGVLGALGLLVNALLWYWFALVRAFLTELLESGDGRKTTEGQEEQDCGRKDDWMAA